MTSHETEDGQVVWYLGGDIAELGVEKSKTEQIEAAEKLLLKIFPWVNLSGSNWESFLINRSEAQMRGGFRPDSAIIKEEKNILVAWPTKFTLVPSLADQVLARVANMERSYLEKTVPLNELQSLFLTPSLATNYWN